MGGLRNILYGSKFSIMKENYRVRSKRAKERATGLSLHKQGTSQEVLIIKECVTCTWPWRIYIFGGSVAVQLSSNVRGGGRWVQRADLIRQIQVTPELNKTGFFCWKPKASFSCKNPPVISIPFLWLLICKMVHNMIVAVSQHSAICISYITLVDISVSF